MVTALIKRLSSQISSLPRDLYDCYEKTMLPTFRELKSWPPHLFNNFSRTFVLVDASDECEDIRERNLFVTLMQEIEDIAVKISVTRRPNAGDSNKQLSTWPRIQISASSTDIRKHIKENVEAIRVISKLEITSVLEEHIANALVDRASGM